MNSKARLILALGKWIAAGILVLGVHWAFSRGANDFTVFFAAWEHVLRGEGLQIYSSSPDRFLYAPGFAWIFAPLALFPKSVALALWCFMKVAGILWLIRALSRQNPEFGYWALLLVARPVLIDLQYGQVNLLILIACAWALLRHVDSGGESNWQDGASWFFAGIAAIGKIFPLPLLLVPFFATSFYGRAIGAKKLKRERIGAVLGVLLVLTAPLLAVGMDGAVSLMHQWKDALMERGLPLESHNQSFAALLHHVASGEPIEIISQHRRQIFMGWKLLTQTQIEWVILFWGALMGALILAWIVIVPKKSPEKLKDTRLWLAVLCGLLILPSHLVWKPYFVMGLPMAVVALEKLSLNFHRSTCIGVFAAAVLMNFTGFDVLGQSLGAQFEAACSMLWAHLILIAVIIRSDRE